MEGELQHLFHEHPLVLKAEESETNDGTHHSVVDSSCSGCLSPILGPFYSCGECKYFLHKVCAELPNTIKHPIHPQHPLTLVSKHPVSGGVCDICDKICEGYVYRCSICDFDVDMVCAATWHTIEDKCHIHPLIPIQTPISFYCNICLKNEKGVSYKCTICPFWVHQRCTLVPNTVKHSEHHHLLTLWPSLPSEYFQYSRTCDICHGQLISFYGSYSCVGCLFFSHIGCTRLETTTASSRSRYQNTEINQGLPPDGQRLVLLPMKQNSTDLISRFVEKYIDPDDIENKLHHFTHKHPLFLIDEQTNEKTCEACTIPISPPSYGCIECDDFLHKCCTDLPREIRHELHPQHQVTLQNSSSFFMCSFCHQWCNGFYYKCSECEDFHIDIKCASLIGLVYHEAHKHPLIPRFISSSNCSACNYIFESVCILKCDTCLFKLCFICAMAPPIVTHRYGKSEPFVLTYSPPENHFDEYLCEICLGELNPKQWHYHCLYADQFAHIRCIRKCGADSNIKYGKSTIWKEVHEHKLTFVRCTYDCTRCSYCREPVRTDFSVGLECSPCNFRIHLECLEPMSREKLDPTPQILGKIQIPTMESPPHGRKFTNMSLLMFVVLMIALVAAIVVNL